MSVISPALAAYQRRLGSAEDRDKRQQGGHDSRRNPNPDPKDRVLDGAVPSNEPPPSSSSGTPRYSGYASPGALRVPPPPPAEQWSFHSPSTVRGTRSRSSYTTAAQRLPTVHSNEEPSRPARSFTPKTYTEATQHIVHTQDSRTGTRRLVTMGPQEVATAFPDYTVRRPGTFFVVGTVFCVLWAPDGGIEQHQYDRGELSLTRSGPGAAESVWARYRLFVVIRTGEGCCVAASIITYGPQGVAKPGLMKSHHGIVHTTKNAPAPLPGEVPQRGELGMRSRPIRVVPESTDAARLDESFRIDYGTLHTFAHNAKAKAFGMVHPLSTDALLSQTEDVHRSRQEQISKDSDSEESSSDDTGDEMPLKGETASSQKNDLRGRFAALRPGVDGVGDAEAKQRAAPRSSNTRANPNSGPSNTTSPLQRRWNHVSACWMFWDPVQQQWYYYSPSDGLLVYSDGSRRPRPLQTRRADYDLPPPGSQDTPAYLSCHRGSTRSNSERPIEHDRHLTQRGTQPSRGEPSSSPWQRQPAKVGQSRRSQGITKGSSVSNETEAMEARQMVLRLLQMGRRMNQATAETAQILRTRNPGMSTDAAEKKLDALLAQSNDITKRRENGESLSEDSSSEESE